MIEAAIFDMDGLLVDTEPMWRAVEIATFESVGIPFTEEDCIRTMGWRSNEVVDFWYVRRPWEGKTPRELETDLLDNMEHQVRTTAEPMPGVQALLQWFTDQGVPMALASSSPTRLINAVVERLGIRHFFQHLVSAEQEPYGKPHPGVFLHTAELLQADPTRCLVFEDSVNGVIAAKAARMQAVAVPAPADFGDPRFGVADLKIPGLPDFSPAHWKAFTTHPDA